MPAPSNLQQLQNMLFLSLLCVTFSSGVHALRQLRQGSTPVAVTDPSGKFGAAPADSADCSSVCQSALGMADVDAGVSGQQACAVYLEQAWLPGITSTDDFKNHADYGVKASPTQDAACNIYSSSSQKHTSVPFKPWQQGSTSLPSFWCLCHKGLTNADWTQQGPCQQGSTAVCRLPKRYNQLGGIITDSQHTTCESANVAEDNPQLFQELCTVAPPITSTGSSSPPPPPSASPPAATPSPPAAAPPPAVVASQQSPSAQAGQTSQTQAAPEPSPSQPSPEPAAGAPSMSTPAPGSSQSAPTELPGLPAALFGISISAWLPALSPVP